MNKVLIDSSFLNSLYSPADNNYTKSQVFAATSVSAFVIPDVILPEVAFLFRRAGGVPAVVMFLERFTVMDNELEPVTLPIVKRAKEIMAAYLSARLDIVDCCIVALAERLQVTQICTYDRRDFSIFRPTHCEFLELLHNQYR